jgi:cell division protein FtsQ
MPVVAVAVLLSPLGAVRSIEVHGASPRWQAAVRAAASGEVGRSVLLADPGRVAARASALAGVRAVRVGLRWPGTLVVDVEERRVAAVVAVPGGLRLLSADGVDLGAAGTAPPGVPRLAVGAAGRSSGVDGAAVAAALGARGDLPASVAGDVTAIGATGADGVWFGLRDGSRVLWGSRERGADKAAALAVLRTSAPHAARYDVSAPDAPAVTPR